MNAASKKAAQQQPNLRSLAIQAEDEMHDLHTTLRAYEAVQVLVAHVPGHALPMPRDVGALLQTLNDGTAARLAALETTLGAMRAAM